MNINTNCKIELCVSKDRTRAILGNVQFEREEGKDNGVMVATDGKRLVVVPVECDGNDTSGPITPQALKECRKSGMGGYIGANGCLELLNGAKYPRPNEGTYPNWKQVIPTFEGKETRKLCFNAQFLADMQAAMGADSVVLEFTNDCLDPILVKPTGSAKAQAGSYGVLMPVRLQ